MNIVAAVRGLPTPITVSTTGWRDILVAPWLAFIRPFRFAGRSAFCLLTLHPLRAQTYWYQALWAAIGFPVVVVGSLFQALWRPFTQGVVGLSSRPAHHLGRHSQRGSSAIQNWRFSHDYRAWPHDTDCVTAYVYADRQARPHRLHFHRGGDAGVLGIAFRYHKRHGRQRLRRGHRDVLCLRHLYGGGSGVDGDVQC